MLKSRVIPCLLLKGESLVKTVQFNRYRYVGDPLNTCRIFNELEVDEMTILDIEASKFKRGPQFSFLQSLTNECFMPLSYGGGITSLEDAQKLFRIGFEKIVINSALFTNPALVKEISDLYGVQSVIVSIDVKKNILGKYQIFSYGGTKKEKVDVWDWIKEMEQLGAGEILLTNIQNEGTWKGFDLELIKSVSDSVNIPIIAHGGAGCKEDVEQAINIAKASAVALGSMVLFQKSGMGVLINYNHNYEFQGEENVF